MNEECIHEVLEQVTDGDDLVIRCADCHYEFKRTPSEGLSAYDQRIGFRMSLLNEEGGEDEPK